LALLLPLLFPDFGLILQILLRREGFMMLRRTLLVSGLILASSLGFANSAKAADATVEFTKTVAGNCSFGATPTPGTLDFNVGNNELNSELGLGTNGSVILTCTGGADVLVAVPVADTGNPAGAPTSFESKLTIGAKNTTSTLGTPITLLPAETSGATIEVDMKVGTGSFPSGNYKYNVVVTANPK
jgi:hypothetical protein